MCIFQGIFQDVIYLSSLGPYLKNEFPCFFELISHFTYGLSQPVPFSVVNLWLTAQLPLLHPSDSKASFHGSCGSSGDLLVLFFACIHHIASHIVGSQEVTETLNIMPGILHLAGTSFHFSFVSLGYFLRNASA